MKNLCSFYPESIGNPHPQAILEDLIDFFPAKIFDVHAHVYRRSIDSVPESIFLAGCPENTVDNCIDSSTIMFRKKIKPTETCSVGFGGATRI
jgi:hypothetical protein